MENKPYTEWNTTVVPYINKHKIFEVFDNEKNKELEKTFRNLASAEKGKYTGITAYIVEHGGTELNNEQTNYKKMQEEIEEQIQAGEYFDILPIDSYMKDSAIIDLLSSLENEKYIKDIYKRKKLKVTGGLTSTQAIILMDCLRQGRSLLQSGRTAEMLSKPLIDFYASSAYAYAIIVINSPLHKSIDSLKGSHGHSYNHMTGTVDFGGDIPGGTFLDLLFSMPIMQINSGDISFKYKLMNSLDFVQNHKISISLLTLLAMVPELQEQYKRVDKEHRCVYPLQVRNKTENMKIKYVFEVGDGVVKPNRDKVKRCFEKSEISESDGKLKITVANDDMLDIMPSIYHDINGQLWYIDSPFEGFVLPEICLHFLIISALCNIMRYSPHEWNDILFNKISSEFSLLISKYLRLFEQKFPMLAAQHLTNYLPILNFM